MVKNKHPKKRPVKEKHINYSREIPDVEKILIENFVSLQKVLVNSSLKFDALTNQISKLLELFEISAKALAEKDYEIEKNNRENTKILEKIEGVLEQNKTIARGLSLMHDKIGEPKNNFSAPSAIHEKSIMHAPSPQRLPFKPPIQKTSTMEGVPGEYHKSISSNEQ
jgi:hypothetical protein